MPELFQVEVHPKAGLTFAGALRGILRADPDVIMVGEIRDEETAGIALEAALTGHFVLSTMHTNDPPRALTRLIDIGVEPHLASAAVTAVLNQRLVRRVCADCRQPVEASEDKLLSIGFSEAQIARGVTMYDSRGCDSCNEGFRGRVGVFQLMLVNEEIAELTTQRPSRDVLKNAALRPAWGLSARTVSTRSPAASPRSPSSSALYRSAVAIAASTSRRTMQPARWSLTTPHACIAA